MLHEPKFMPNLKRVSLGHILRKMYYKKGKIEKRHKYIYKMLKYNKNSSNNMVTLNPNNDESQSLYQPESKLQPLVINDLTEASIKRNGFQMEVIFLDNDEELDVNNIFE